MVILFLIVLWAIVLTPSILRSRSHGRLGDSIGAFQRHLRNLRRGTGSAPNSDYAEALSPSELQVPVVAQLPPPAKTVSVVRILRDDESDTPAGMSAPAETRGAVESPALAAVSGGTGASRRFVAVPGGAASGGMGAARVPVRAPVAVDDAMSTRHPAQDVQIFIDADEFDFDAPGAGRAPLNGVNGAHRSGDAGTLEYDDDVDYPARGAQFPRMTAHEVALRRRRDVLTVLGVSLVGCLVLGIIPLLRPLWYLGAVVFLALGAYVGVLVRVTANAMERREKVTVLPSSRYVPVGSSAPHVVTYLDDAEPVVFVSAAGGAV